MVQVAFLYNAQDHHLFHSLPIACELSRLNLDINVVVIARTAAQLDLARQLSSFYPGHRLQFQRLSTPFGLEKLPVPKLLLLVANRHMLKRFKAIVVPERTSLYLKSMGVKCSKFIHSFHGSSGHDRIEDPRIKHFDLLLAPSPKRLQRLLDGGAARPGHATVIGYTKLDLIKRLFSKPPSLFNNTRPTVLYNPHHWIHKSSWPLIGWKILDYFAASNRYNLIFAPHVRLFDRRIGKYRAFRKYLGLEHIRLDLGSRASIDMSYTLAADFYLGDVSSQVFEFLIKPRPCIFLNPRKLRWNDDADFASWRLGKVVETVVELDQALATVEQWQSNYFAQQHEARMTSFPETLEPAPILGARAIVEFLQNGRVATYNAPT
jgi:hypothetical protein